VIARVIDLSPAPFFLWGSGYAESTLLPWVSRIGKTRRLDGAPRRRAVAPQFSADRPPVTAAIR